MVLAPSAFFCFFARVIAWANGEAVTYKKAGAWHLQFYQTEKSAAGKLVKVRRSERLCEAKDVTHKYANGLAVAEMGKIEANTITERDMPVTDFWEHHYLPYCEKEGKGTEPLMGVISTTASRKTEHVGIIGIETHP